MSEGQNPIDKAQSAEQPVQQEASQAAHQDTEDEASDQEELAERALRRSRELRDVQIELDRVNKLYKRKTPLVC
jgi:hypothetical protein